MSRIDAELRTTIARLLPTLIETRHAIHQRPELSDSEAQTARLVAEQLQALGLDVQTGVGGHGVLATIRGAHPGRTLALRADMDALPIQEESASPYRSQSPGVMHACGHDGHTTMLLGAAHVLAKHRESLTGDVRLIFQPAEETGQGARRMCAAGAMTGVNAAVALHAWPPLPVGQIGLRLGAMTASADTFEITIHGRGAHGAYPHLAIDPIVVAAHLVVALQNIVSREIDPVAPAVLTVGQIRAGTAPNIIPETAFLSGTVRTHAHSVRAQIPEGIRRIVEGVCAAHRARGEVRFPPGTPPVINDAPLTAQIADTAARFLGAENVVLLPQASMGGEDFAEYLAYAPGALLRLGLGDSTPLHTPGFDFPDSALPTGIGVLSSFALHYLQAPENGG